MGVGMGAKRVPAVVGHVEPLVSVGRPRVGNLDSGGELAGGGVGRGPQPEGAVYVHPGAMVVGCGGPGLKVVEGAAVDVAGLEAHDRRSGRTSGEDAG